MDGRRSVSKANLRRECRERLAHTIDKEASIGYDQYASLAICVFKAFQKLLYSRFCAARSRKTRFVVLYFAILTHSYSYNQIQKTSRCLKSGDNPFFTLF